MGKDILERDREGLTPGRIEEGQGRGEETVTRSPAAVSKVASTGGHTKSCWFPEVNHIRGLWRGPQLGGRRRRPVSESRSTRPQTGMKETHRPVGGRQGQFA